MRSNLCPHRSIKCPNVAETFWGMEVDVDLKTASHCGMESTDWVLPSPLRLSTALPGGTKNDLASLAVDASFALVFPMAVASSVSFLDMLLLIWILFVIMYFVGVSYTGKDSQKTCLEVFFNT